jgi:hypothetical protein
MMKIISARDPKFNENGTIDLIVNTEEFGEIPFTASPNDSEEHSIDLHRRALFGEFGEVVPFTVDINKLKNQKLNEVNNEKNRVRETGVIIDNILFDSDKNAYDAYARFAIRVITDPTYVTENWKASDGVWVTMDATLLSKLINALSVKETLAFNWLKAKQEAINSAFNSNDIHTLELISTVYE